jgi:hypothetical protein
MHAILTAELQARENKSDDYKKDKASTHEAAGGFTGAKESLNSALIEP